MYKRLVCSGPDTIAWEEYELPKELLPGQLRVRNTHGAEKHGTMMSFVHGHGNRRGRWDSQKQLFVAGGMAWNYPIALGNMQVGIVEEAGTEAGSFTPGDRVAYFHGFAPATLIGGRDAWKLRADTCWKAATCLDPATYALCALRDGNVRVGDAIAIFSCGAIGLMAVQIAKLAGCYPIIAIDPLANRRVVASRTGADLVIDPVGTDVGQALREATDGRGADVVIEYSGTMEALQAALRGIAYGGNLVAGAFPGPMKAGLDLGAEAHMNRANIIFSRTESDPNRDHPRWNVARIRSTVQHLILEGKIDASRVITPILKFSDDLRDQYDAVVAKPENGIKLGVEY